MDQDSVDRIRSATFNSARRGYDPDICRKVIDKLMKPGEDD